MEAKLGKTLTGHIEDKRDMGNQSANYLKSLCEWIVKRGWKQ